MIKLTLLLYVGMLGFAFVTLGCSMAPTFGSIERLDPRFDELVPAGAKIEKLAEGFEWTEGPVWIPDGEYVLFSDIPNNVIHKWKEGEGITTFLRPAGYTGSELRGEELGTNGLVLPRGRCRPDGNLILCEHGDRRVTRLEIHGQKTTLADNYEGQRLNSPNDAVVKSNGDIYFTDPPYGLINRWDDPARELDFCGVYRIRRDGELTLLTREMSRPNGIAFSPDERTLYLANSDGSLPIWMAYDVAPNGLIANGRVFADARTFTRPGLQGGPDGMKVDEHGNLFATGPGGVNVFSPDGTLLGRINPGERTANCTFGDDGSTLYMTADMYLCRIRLTTKGVGF